MVTQEKINILLEVQREIGARQAKTTDVTTEGHFMDRETKVLL